MALPPSHQEQYRYYEVWRDHLQQFPWEWFCTFTFEPRTNFFTAVRRFENWRFSIIDGEGLAIGASLMSSHKRGHLHFHVLLLGSNRFGKTLRDCHPGRWSDAWYAAFRTSARIRPVDNIYRDCDYVARHFLGFKSDRAETDSFGINELQKHVATKLDLFRL